jgi:hypothetical protein
MMQGMTVDAWLDRDEQFRPGAELYRSDRVFQVWDYTSTHSQLLLRAAAPDRPTRVDVLFKPVDVMKVHGRYDGLRIRCATEAEATAIRAGTPGIPDTARCLVLEPGGGGSDYVFAGAVGWHEDTGLGEPSYFADPSSISPPASPWAGTALFGVNGGFGTPLAGVEELAAVIAAGEGPVVDREGYRYVYVVAGQFPEPSVFSVHLTREEAERRRAELDGGPLGGGFTVHAAPVAL